MRVFLIAGEPSGDRLGAAAMAGLRSLRPEVEFDGIGGDLMAAQGLRSRFGGVLIANSGFGSPTTRDEVRSLIADGHADAVAVGRPVMANPDLVERWQGGHPENELADALARQGMAPFKPAPPPAAGGRAGPA